MTPELLQYLIGVALVVVGYFLRHRGITIPGLPGPSGNPLVAHPILSNVASAFAGYFARAKGVKLPGESTPLEAAAPGIDAELVRKLRHFLDTVQVVNTPAPGDIGPSANGMPK